MVSYQHQKKYLMWWNVVAVLTHRVHPDDALVLRLQFHVLWCAIAVVMPMCVRTKEPDNLKNRLTKARMRRTRSINEWNISCSCYFCSEYLNVILSKFGKNEWLVFFKKHLRRAKIIVVKFDYKKVWHWCINCGKCCTLTGWWVCYMFHRQPLVFITWNILLMSSLLFPINIIFIISNLTQENYLRF